MAYPYQMNVGNQQPNLAGGMNNQMPGQVPNMGVPNMGVPPAPMPYQPQPMFGMPQTYGPYPQQQGYGQTSYSPASSPTGQQMNWNAIPDFRQFGNMGGYKFTEPMYTPPPPGSRGTLWPGGEQQMQDFNAQLRNSESGIRQQLGLPMYGGEDDPRFQSAMQSAQNSIRSQMGLPQPGMGGQQPIGGLGQTNPVPQFFTDYANQILTKQPANTPQYTTYSAGPMGLPVTIDQSLMGGAATGNQQPTLAQQLLDDLRNSGILTKSPTANQPVNRDYGSNGGLPPLSAEEAEQRRIAGENLRKQQLQDFYGQYNFDPVTQDYLTQQYNRNALSGGDAGLWKYNPQTQSFTLQGAYTSSARSGGQEPTISLAEMQQRAKADAAARASSPDQSPFGVKPIAVQTGAPPTAAPVNRTPMPTLTPQQIAKRNMMNLQQSLLEAGSRGPAGLQRFLDQLPKTGLTPQQVRAQQQAQMQLRNQQRLRNPSLSSDPFTYTPRPAAPVRSAPTPQVNQVTRRMNPNGTFSIA